MDKFLSQYNESIVGTLSCFDRIVFKGHLPLGWPEAMERFLSTQGLLIKDFGRFVNQQSERIRLHAEATAAQAGRPYIYLRGNERKEDLVKRIIQRDALREGLVCVLRTVEPCQSFRLQGGATRPRLVSAPRKCLHFYFYFLDREFGLLHVRIQAWFPLTVQICLNGHDYLARKLDHYRIAHRRCDNAFLEIADPARAQKLADRFLHRNWPRILTALARRANPLLRDTLKGMQPYWVIDQAEYATDVMFSGRTALQALYPTLLRHASLCLGAEDLLTFLGRKLHGSFQGEVLTDLKHRWQGARVKHRVKENWMKMYDKFGCVLRVETVINRPNEFRVRRRGKRQGQLVTGWFPMAKGVANLYRYAEVSRSANYRYLNAMAAAKPIDTPGKLLRQVARPATTGTQRYRALNPAALHDVCLFAAVARGEHALHGFRNHDIRERLFGSTVDAADQPRQRNRVSRLLRILRAHGLVAKVPRSRRWRVTDHGRTILTITLNLHPDHAEVQLPKAA
jgi:hypothetical protein